MKGIIQILYDFVRILAIYELRSRIREKFN